MSEGSHRSGFKSAGFTIVETMIVLAVTGVLFVIIAATLGGRENQAEFVHAIQDVQAQIQQVINQESDGYYPNLGTFSCAGSGLSIIINSQQTNNPQGTNPGCVFLGKVIQFAPSDGAAMGGYMTYTVAGCYTTPVTPAPPASCPAPSSPHDFGATDPQIGDFSLSPQILEYGLTIYRLNTPNSIGGSLGAIGLLMEVGSPNSLASGEFNSGAQQIDLLLFPDTNTDQGSTAAKTAINTSLQKNTYTLNPSSGVQVCFASGGTNQSGLITIGGSGRQLLVQLKIYNDNTCT